jgi:hypothetical protein
VVLGDDEVQEGRVSLANVYERRDEGDESAIICGCVGFFSQLNAENGP